MNRRRQSGFLLLEVIFAVGLIAIAMVALIESLTRCIAAAKSIQDYTTAEALLANKSYEYRVEQPLDYDNESGRFDDFPGYAWERTLEASDTDGLWVQTITVTWQERSHDVSDRIVEYRYLPDKKQ